MGGVKIFSKENNYINGSSAIPYFAAINNDVLKGSLQITNVYYITLSKIPSRMTTLLYIKGSIHVDMYIQAYV